MAISIESLQYYKVTLPKGVYMILNPRNWEELSYGIHNNLLTCNNKTELNRKNELDYLISLLSTSN